MPDSAKWYRYLRFWRPNVAADVDDELAFHIDARTEELSKCGMPRSAARAQALREFGDMERTRVTLRAMDEHYAAVERRVHVVADLSRDVRVALRGLARAPGLVVVVGLTFALGIGVTTAIYSVVDAYMFRPLPGVHGADLVVLGRTDKDIPQPHDLSYADARDYRSDTAVFADLAIYTTRTIELNSERGVERLWVDEGSANYFSVLGLRPLLGRTFATGEDAGVMSHPLIVLTYKAWQARFAGDSSVVGRVIRVNDHPVTVIGVMPPEFHGVRPLLDLDGVICVNQVWPATANLDDRASFGMSAVAVLRHGVSLSRAREAVRLDARRLEHEYPTTNKNVGVVLVPERYSRPSVAISSLTPALAAVFMTLVMLVLLVACANVASLLLARVVVRSRELAIRAAIGASQWRLVRHILVECGVLAVIGGLGALAVADASIRALDAIHLATDIPMRWGLELNGRLVLFTTLATILAAVIAGLAPAAAARRRNLNELLKSSAGNSALANQQRLRSMLVVGQIAVSVVVLVAAGLFARSAANASRMTLGFRSDHLLMMSTALRPQSHDSTSGRQFYGELVRRAAAVPGVRSAALAAFVPFGYNLEDVNVFPIASSVNVPANGFSYFTNVVGGGYFDAMDIPVLQGRVFNVRDDERAPRVVVVNDAAARALWPGESAIGKRMHLGGAAGPLVEVVGVVRGMQVLFPGEAPKPYVFQPFGQVYRSEMTLMVHTAQEPTSLVSSLRAIFTSLDATTPVFDVRSMEEHLHNGPAFLFTRLGSAFSGVFGLLALVLASIGVYGVVSYSVAQRTREIGVRVALGARLTTILRLVVGQGMRLAWIGTGVGLLLSLATTGVLSSILFGVAPRDPLVLGGVIATLLLIAGMACLVPAWRATRIDPLIAIRSE
ncbi:MAG TPA: ABC transporter permease [Gemmatimonadaceae bacterium]|nr:ABC transporter permease [Gemmatimonadaceae bacterium]